jgi:hypothetical protein
VEVAHVAVRKTGEETSVQSHLYFREFDLVHIQYLVENFLFLQTSFFVLKENERSFYALCGVMKYEAMFEIKIYS